MYVACTHVNGKYHGLYSQWSDCGYKEIECYYVNGKLHGLYRSNQYLTGHWQKEMEYINGKRHGLYQEWDEYGAKIVECNYVNGELHGLYRSKCNLVTGQWQGKLDEWQQEMECVNGVTEVERIEMKGW
jgi:antitoxin component YwqK of YwqJK toxin-antitoxin module